MDNVYLPDIVGKGYKAFWHFTGRYRAVKGGRGSKKSKTTALNLITRMMQVPGANTLVVRKVYRTLKDSCFTELRWAARRLRCEKYWNFRESPLEMTYRPTGQKIYFRGLDDPQKIASLAPERGSLCWMWVEEAFEIQSERDFAFLDECLRGNGGVFKQITLTFNPWNEKHWLNGRFFQRKRKDTLAITTTYRCNEFLDAADKKLFADMKKRDPRRYQVAGLGNWGISEGLIYENWREEAFDWRKLPETARGPRMERGKPPCEPMAVFGLDFGYAADPAALFCGLFDKEKQRLYVFDELYEKRLTNRALFQRVEEMGYRKEAIRADAAEPKSIDELRELGLCNIRAARKGPDSVRNGIRALQGVEIIVHPRCVNFLTEISCYAWDTDGFNRPGPYPDHLMDAMRYAMEGAGAGAVFGW
ncbi:MAG: PBSX family phage terminase large subunit [Oscillospiraceae bacterium]|nr:PBSX family phage terminase large subunit [Oscillospiraceae bacterium]